MTKTILDLEKIDMLRREKGWSMSAMCRNAQIARQTYKNIVEGENVGIVVVFKLAKALGVNVPEILCK